MNRYFAGFLNNWFTERTKPGFVSVWIIFPFTSAWIAGDYFWYPGTDQVEKVGRAWVSLRSMNPRKGVSYSKCPPWIRSVAGSVEALRGGEIRSGMRIPEDGCLPSRRPEPGRGVPDGAAFCSRVRVRQRHSDTYRCSARSRRAREIGGASVRGRTTPHRVPLPNLAQPGEKTSRQRSPLRDPF